MTSPLRDIIAAAKVAGLQLAAQTPSQRQALLNALATAFESPAVQGEIIAANSQDVGEAQAAQASGALAPALVKRLGIDARKIATLVDGLRQLARAPEVAGRQLTHRMLDDGLVLKRVSCPLGVLGVV